MPEPVRIAFFGNGFARTTMLPCLRHVEGIHLAGIASPNLDRARATAQEFGIEQVSSDYREILDTGRPHLVFVATPPHRHKEMAIDALRAGCHVVCEKPTALSGAESAEMLAAARAAKVQSPTRLALIDHELRFDPRREALRRLVAEGKLGQILHANYTLHSWGSRDPAHPWNWWSDREQGGGALGAIGSHAVDALRALLGEVDEVRGHLETAVKERPDPETGRPRLVTADDLALAWLRFRSGALAAVQISTVEAERMHRVSLAGSEGAARIDEHGPLRVAVGHEARAGTWEEPKLLEDLPPSSQLGIPESDWARSFLRLARQVVAAIQEGRAVVPLTATFEDGHRNQLVLDAIRRSAEKEKWVEVAPS